MNKDQQQILIQSLSKLLIYPIWNIDSESIKTILYEQIQNDQILLIHLKDISLNKSYSIWKDTKTKEINFTDTKLPQEPLLNNRYVLFEDPITHNDQNIALLQIYFKQKNAPIELTKEEIQYIQNTTVNYCINFREPFESLNENKEHIGITKDYLDLISQNTGLQFSLVQTKNQKESLLSLQNGDCQLKLMMLPTQKTKEYLNFTSPYIDFPYVIATKLDKDYISKVEDILDKPIGVVKGYETNDILKKEYSNIQIVLVDTIEEGLTKVARGELEYFIDLLPSVSHGIKKLNKGNIKISGQLTDKTPLSAAIIKQDQLLFTIIEKSLHSISKKEHAAIVDKWLSVKVEKEIDYELVWKIVLAGFSIILFIVYWNRKLAQEIKVRKNTEEKLKLAEQKATKLHKQALQASNAKGDFLANMSHEIRTPMNAIIGLSRIALKKNDLKAKNEYLEKILLSSNNLLEIINDILDFSKIEAGKVDLEHIQFNIYDILYSCYIMFENICNEKGLELQINYDQNIPDSLMGDPTRLKQVLINFLSNAVKFTQKGKITVDIKIVENIIDQENITTIYFGVTDSGKGIVEEHKEKLFDAFTQEDESTTRKHGGTGLGLAISKRFIELMDGKIGFESKLGAGSTFYAVVPFQNVSENTHFISFGKHIKNISDTKILTLDDDKNDSIILTDMLSSYQFNVTHTIKEKEAYEYIQKENFDLLILDWKLKEISGVDFYKKVLEDTSITYKPKAIIVSAYDKYDILQNCKELEEEPYIISKPFSSEELLSIIIKIISNTLEKKDTLNIDTDHIHFENQMILLVEDNELNQEVAKEILENSGLSILIANNGEEAYHIFMENHKDIELILMDLQMPLLDGYEASRKIRNEEVGEDIPIIALSADVVSGIKDKVLATGMNDYATKPIEPHILLSLIAKYLPFSMVENESHDSIIESLPTIYGIDIQKEIKRMSGNQKLYFNILKKFCKNYGDFIQQCIKDNQLQNIQQLQSNLHQLKGVVGNIGAHKLYTLVLETELLVKQSLPCDQELLKIKYEITQIIDSIQNSIPDDKEKSPTKDYDQKRSKEILEEIIKMLDLGDSDVLELIEELQQQKMPKELKQLLEKIYVAVDDFEYQDALNLTLEMKKLLKDQ